LGHQFGAHFLQVTVGSVDFVVFNPDIQQFVLKDNTCVSFYAMRQFRVLIV
jgi:hypothetical protein